MALRLVYEGKKQSQDGPTALRSSAGSSEAGVRDRAGVRDTTANSNLMDLL